MSGLRDVFANYESTLSENNGYGRLPEERRNRHIVLAVALAFGAFLVFFRDSFAPLNFPRLVCVASLVIFSVAVGYLLEGLCIFGEEIFHVNTRHFGKFKQSFRASLHLGDVRVLVCCLVLPLLLLAYFDAVASSLSFDLMAAFALATFSFPLVTFFLRGSVFGLHDKEDQSRNSGRGLAWAYYCGFLKYVIEVYEESLEKSKWGQEKGRMKCFYVFIPKNCVIFNSFAEADENIKHEGRFEIFSKTRAGVKKRRYTCSMYSTQVKNKTFFFHMEYPAILKTLNDMTQDDDSLMDSDLRATEVNEFYLTLKAILENSTVCKLIPFSGDTSRDSISGILKQLVMDTVIGTDEMHAQNIGPTLTTYKYSSFVMFDLADQAFIEKHVIEPLEAKGFRLCLPSRNLIGGKDFCKTVEMGVEESRHMIIAFSSTFLRNRKDDMKFIIEIALKQEETKRNFAVPISVGSCDIPDVWAQYPSILDFFSHQSQRSKSTNRLIQALQA